MEKRYLVDGGLRMKCPISKCSFLARTSPMSQNDLSDKSGTGAFIKELH